MDFFTIFWMVSLPVLSCLPFILALYMLLKDPDIIHYLLFIFMATSAFWVGEFIFGSVFNTPLYTPESLRWVFSTIAQGYAALIGILGSFLIYHLQTLKDVSRTLRKDVSRRITDFDSSKVIVDDRNFIAYLNRIYKKTNQPEIKNSLYFLGVIQEEKKAIENMIKYQFIFLFASVFLSLILLLIEDGYLIVYGILFKLMVYVVFSIAITALLSTVRSIFKLTQTGNFY